MIRCLAGATTALLAGAALLTAAGTAQAAPPAPAARAGEVDFTGIVALSNCSGSLVRGPRSRDTDHALVLTNGHCLESGMPAAGEVIAGRSSARTFTLVDPGGGEELGTLKATGLEYATMTDTDVALYRLARTYGQIRNKYGIGALRLSPVRPRAGAGIRVVSGYWKKIYSCEIDGFVHRLREAGWTWKDSIRYTPGCGTVGGTSGAPIVDARSRRVVGVNNTGNDRGGRCTLHNPCEVGRDGGITVREGYRYGQQTYPLARCLGRGNEVVLGGTCALPRPA